MNLLERINAIEKRMNEIHTEISGLDVSKEENRSKMDTLEKEYNTKKEERAALMKLAEVQPIVITKGQVRAADLGGGSGNPSDKLSTMEYRQAFMAYIQTGKRSAVLDEVRADATTMQSDVSAVIPTTIQNRIIDTLTVSGRIYARISKTNLPSGTRFPINSVNPVASWVSENAKSDRQKMTLNSHVEFGSYKLQVRVATSLETATNSLDIFEKLVADKIVKAIIKAIETAVISGTGLGQPTGLTVDTRIQSAQKVATTIAQLNYAGWVERYGKIPAAYLDRDLVWLMHQDTFFKYVMSLVDTTGQPVARTIQGIDGKPKHILLGHEVIFENSLPTADAATANQLFVIFGDLSEYDFNSNLTMTYRKYVDEETDEFVDKITLLGDGKVLDPNPFIFFKKATA